MNDVFVILLTEVVKKMLKLVIDNTKQRENCRIACDLFDNLTESCSVIVDADISNPATISGCRYFLSKRFVQAAIEMDAEQLRQEESYIATDKWLYPLFPDEPANREDAVWFLSPCMNYGCWIINNSKQKLYAISSSLSNRLPEEVRVYKSLCPLHNHHAPIPLASKVAWYVNEEGYGAYMLLDKGKLVPIHKNNN
jgi:hypothetical protein